MNHLFYRFKNKIHELVGYAKTYGQIEVSLIINPVACSLSKKRRLKKIIDTLEEKTRFQEKEDFRLHKFKEYYTKEEGHAEWLVQKIAKEKSNSIFHLIISAGGDGTRNEVLTGLVKSRPRKEVRILSLPLGSANDTIKDLESSINLLTGNLKAKKVDALRITDEEEIIKYYAFNIASIGLDAFVAKNASYLKKYFKEKAYRISANISPMFYESGRKLNLSLDKEQLKISPLLIAMGVSGNRKYGYNIPVLPSDENICIVDDIGFLTQYKNKKKLYKGDHKSLGFVHFYSSNNLHIKGNVNGINLQVDGEIKPTNYWKEIKIDMLKEVVKVVE